MASIGETWRLCRGKDLFGQLIVTDADLPWLNARPQAEPGFELIRPLFEEKLRRLDAIEEDLDAWEAAYKSIREAVSLVAPDGRRVPEVLLTSKGRMHGGGGAMSRSLRPTRRSPSDFSPSLHVPDPHVTGAEARFGINAAQTLRADPACSL